MTRSLLAMILAALPLGAAFADEAPEPKPAAPSSFGEAGGDKPLPAVAPGDFEGLLRNCDAERSRAEEARKLCEKDKTSIPFLTAAYLALWAILMVFFGIVAVRQKRLRAEMMTLRERLARLGDDAR